MSRQDNFDYDMQEIEVFRNGEWVRATMQTPLEKGEVWRYAGYDHAGPYRRAYRRRLP